MYFGMNVVEGQCFKPKVTWCRDSTGKRKLRKKSGKTTYRHSYFFDFALGLIFYQSLPTQMCYELDRLSAKYCKASHAATDIAVTALSP